MKNGEHCAWYPMYHRTDSKITVHAFYCHVGLSLLNYLHHKVTPADLDLTIDQMID